MTSTSSPRKLLPEDAAASLMRHGGNLVAIFVVVAKPAGLEHIPEVEVAQLDLRARAGCCPVSRPSNGACGSACNSRMNSHTPGADLGLAIPQDVVEPEDVALEEPPESCRRRRDLVEAEELAHQAVVRAPGEFQALEPSAALNSSAKVRAKALTPAPPVWTSVPSMSNKTRRTMCGESTGMPRVAMGIGDHWSLPTIQPHYRFWL